MKILRSLCAFLLFLTISGSAVPVAASSSVASVVIAQVQTGASVSASQEYISLYNNTAQDINVTGWCLFYNTSMTKPGCIAASNSDTTVWLQAHSYTTFASTQFVVAHSGFVPQAHPAFSGGLSDNGGLLTLLDSEGIIQDQFSWSSKAAPDMIYQRATTDSVTLQDTDNDGADFAQTILTIPSNLGLYEQAIARDLCPNIPDVQTILPEGFLRDDAGDCWQDMCPNLPNLQTSLPANYELQSGACNLIPLEDAALEISELLPNATGYDTGNEFVELYNPLDRPVQLAGYTLQLGPSFTKMYTFSNGSIDPNQYSVFSDTTLGIPLPNTSANLRLIAPNGAVVSTTDNYTDPADDVSWALIEGRWQYTDMPTPGGVNIMQVAQTLAISPSVASALKPCPAGKYRNPTTNRCRNLQAATSSLQPCAANQYRSPETNRCRNVATLAGTSLTPCQPGQERNPTTNRCKKTGATASSLQPCGAGKERNPDTNRCRNVLSASSANTKPPETMDDDSHTINVVIVASVLCVIFGYAIYEYRYDLQNAYLRLRHK